MLKAKILALSMLMFLGWKPKSIYFFFFLIFHFCLIVNCNLIQYSKIHLTLTFI